MIDIKNLNKIYETDSSKTIALDNITLQLPNNGFIALYGENGCGKTTLLNLLSTIDTKYTGQITYNDLSYKANEEYLRRTILSYVFQEEQFIDFLNVKDNLSIFCENEDIDTIKNQLSLHNIAEKLNENPANLSGGQKQRTSLIRGFLKQSEVLLVDEPTSSLNEEMELFVFDELKAISKTKLVILVSHNFSLIQKYCDIILNMDKGKITKKIDLVSTQEIEYNEDSIILPEDNFNFSLIDNKKAQQILDTNSSLKILKGNCPPKKSNLDYSVKENVKALPQKSLNKKTFFNLFTCATKKTLSLSILFSLLISLIAVFFTYLLSFINFDKAKFTYESLNKDEDYIPFSLTQINDTTPLDSSEYEYLKTELNSNVIIQTNIEGTVLDFQSNGIYENALFKLAYCQENDVSIIKGSFPKDNNSVLLTDYTADGIIQSNSDYKSFDDLIEKGYTICGNKFNISGIVDTDYEKYISLYDKREFIESRQYYDFELAFENEYAVLYYSYDAFNTANQLTNFPIEYGSFFTDIIKISDYNSNNNTNYTLNSNECYVNQCLYEMLELSDKNNYIKMENFHLNIAGVIDDSATTPKIYSNDDDLTTIKDCQINQIYNMNIKLGSIDAVDFLLERHFNHFSSASSFIRSTIDAINLLQSFFIVLLIIILSILFGIIFYLLNRILKQQDKTIALMKSIGYKKKSIFLFTFALSLISSITTIVLSVILYIASALILNSSLSSIFERTIAIANINIFIILITIFSLCILFTLSWFLIMNKKDRKDIIILLKS